ncbi:efflux RND transporter periplasmic adaptor subunit [Aestuariibacter sp. GS-14]|uniref:efflux RND transporter periplasmic adaptor subunit n=1 Tax=Aestuariibacter sp. GS-14 TaxID=2590670 RepID=UPI00112DD611|nr:efflux RND transporter periplasmic adaptor subunit [Aestuariibacter sp. GS-14]TPV53918.1 efflux RND transporter periplasmic adaptor subunit [Aestuariibacter sp. GS-14]
MSTRHTARLFLLSAIATVVLAGCGSDAQQPAQQMTAPTVSVAEVVNMQVSDWDEFSGRLSAPESVTLMPRVSGYVNHIHFKEGALVKEGDVLLDIDPTPFEVDVARLQAELDSAASQLTLAKNDYERGQRLSKQQAISQEALDGRFAALQQAQANVSAISAALKRAELDLSYTKVTAPVSGRVSRAHITQGNYVTAGQSALTSIVSVDEMYAYFSVDEQTYLRYVRSEVIQSGFDNNNANQPVALALSGDNAFQYRGYIDFVDNQVDQQTGGITVRARFSNDDGVLMPGLYAHIRLAGSQPHDGILIDEKAVGTDLNNKFVLVVAQNNAIEYRPITLGESVGDLRLVTSGLQPGDTIVVNGLQRVMPGMTINPDLTPMADDATLTAIAASQAMLDPTQIALSASFDVTATQ